MSKPKVMGRAATRAVLTAGGVAFLIALSCGEPLGPRPFPWSEAYTFPGNVRISAVTCYPHGLTFASGSVRDGAPAREYAVLYYNEAGFAEVYRSPYPDSAFEDVRSYFYRHCVAAGWRVAGTARRPLVVRYEGGTVYTEVDIPADVTASSFTKVYPRNEGVYWILGDDGVYLYEWGRWRRVADAAGAKIKNKPSIECSLSYRRFYGFIIGECPRLGRLLNIYEYISN